MYTFAIYIDQLLYSLLFNYQIKQLFSFVTVRNGYSCVPVALADGLDIRLGTAVTEIQYSGPGVTVKVNNSRSPNQQDTFKGKIYLCKFNVCSPYLL